MTRWVTVPESRELRLDGSMPGGWWHEDAEHGRIVCDLCPRECHLKPGDRGFCFVRQNVDGEMVLTTYGRSTGFCIDPIEKKPLNHFYPGTSVLSFGTAGCNLGCKFCQNWDISKSREVARLSATAGPESIAHAARELGCRSVAFTYNDPIIWAEYAIDTARACHAVGLKTVAVTAGYICETAREPFFGAIDAANVDLKAFTENFYERLVYAHLKPVLETIEWLKKETDVWIELTNLIIPDANDSDDELRQMCDWILEHCGPEVPVHFSAFHPDFRLRDRGPTPPETLVRAYDIARECGIRYPYVGNVHDAGRDSTYCPQCGTVLIERDWYELDRYRIQNSRCPECQYRIAGHFEDAPGDWGRKRLPVDMSHYQVAPATSSAGTATHSNNSGKELQMVERQDGPRAAAEPRTARAEADILCPEAPALTSEQEGLLHRSACEVIAARAQGRAAQLDEAALTPLNQIEVGGAFVTARNAGKLRGCCGTLGTRQGAWDAVQHAARRTAAEDPRFPGIEASELKPLNVDVTLLFNFRKLEVQGERRRDAIQVGRDGLIIRQGRATGLLLPVVAEEHGVDAEGFLRMTCRKAGLPVEAWKREDAEVTTFEGLAFGGPFVGDVDTGGSGGTSLPAGDVETYTQFCRDNLNALLTGATPSYYCTSAADATVGGVAVLLHLPSPDQVGAERPVVFSQLTFKDALPLQSTLFRVIETAAGQLHQRGIRDLQGIDVELIVLSDTTFHGKAAQAELTQLDCRTRALCVREGSRFALSWSPGTAEAGTAHAPGTSAAPTLLDRLVESVGSTDAAQSEVYSFHVEREAGSGMGGLELMNVPRGQIAEGKRPAAVAGLFYPGDAEGLERALDDLLPATDVPREHWPAVMLPHAGYRYSGRVAGTTLARVEIPESVIVIGPKHTPHGLEWAVAPHASWQIPGGVVASDPQLAQKLVEEIPGLELDAAAHAREHGIEVELPLIHRLAPEARVVGIVIGGGDYARCRAFGQHLARVLRSLDTQPLLVISSDMNHFADDTTNRRLDEIAMGALETLDPERLLSTVRGHEISMCGVLPATIVLETLRALGQLERSERVAYATSADAGADRDRVVGYAGMLFGPRPSQSSSSTLGESPTPP